ncbi:hypothetical protein OIDMADRAFT_149564 [Oidiodendron maius Zn]|uniref:Zn(2)-C6 fungal-type domain-containing protein n=1 Tax=Oidiodendron maius (strain Zn) TaxID=913774 RepID=A0A0C3CX06_OIDMZ|nr:hypothetical protein OIDMADRAFT_149564 [Oidiodendron maius Zn]
MDSCPAPAPPATNPAAIPRRRRYHTKSHNACSHCRRRRIRCSKTRPVCAGCARRDLACEYPAGSHRHGPPRALLPAIQMHSVFTTLLPPTDMPLFEHFRTTAYPHVPLANDRIWRTEIPRLVNAYPFLAHAILGLAASHISLIAPSSNMQARSLAYRVQAVRGLNGAFSAAPRRREDGDALLATCYALSMQALYIGESVSEFLVMLRGCHVLMTQRWAERLGTVFGGLGGRCWFGRLGEEEEEGETCWFKAEGGKQMNGGLRCGTARESLERVGELCRERGRGMEGKVWGWLMEIVLTLEASSYQALLKFGLACIALPALPEEEFRLLMDPSNVVAKILLIHFASILVLIYPVRPLEWGLRDLGGPNGRTIFRMALLCSQIPPPMLEYIAWPMSVSIDNLEEQR